MNRNDLSGNPRRYVRFTVFYNARAYYPVLAILFLDLGVTLDQFILLNLVWAATIFLFEVPSGAMADTIGRKKLLVVAAALMVIEMLCLLFAPRGGGVVLLGLCVINRICSGLSEACASGADEALAYDSLPEENREGAWDKLLATAMRWRSFGFFVAMILGGLIYDAATVNRFLPQSWHVSVGFAHRLPILVVLCQAIICLVTTLRMVEPPREIQDRFGHACKGAVKLTLQTARWVFTNPKTLMVVVLGMAIDSVVRNFATINSSYYRMIELPEWSFGIVGSALGLLGWFTPSIAKKANERFGLFTCLALAAAVVLVGLCGLLPMWKFFGVLPAMLLMLTLGFLGFTVSRELHRSADSSRRATVLSVKGLAFNFAYGAVSLGFSRLVASFPDQPPGAALKMTLFWQVPIFVAGMIVLFAWAYAMKSRKI